MPPTLSALAMSNMMLAAEYSKFSSNFNEITVKSVKKPTVSHLKGFALIKIHAASINPVDIMVKTLPSAMAFLGGSFMSPCLNSLIFRPLLNLQVPNFAVKLPFIPGFDFSGVIESVSDDVTNFQAGDEVFSLHWGIPFSVIDEYGMAGGAFAEYIAYPVARLSRKPASVPHTIAAALPMVGGTGEVPMRMAGVKAGDRVLVLGGSSAIGSMAIQAAKLKGAYVITTCSTRALQYVQQFHPDEIINYEQHKWYEVVSDLTLVYDAIGDPDAPKQIKTNAKIVKQGNTLVLSDAFITNYLHHLHQVDRI